MSNPNVAKGREMLREVEAALKPIIEKYKEHAHPKAFEQWEEGLIYGPEMIQLMFERITESA